MLDEKYNKDWEAARFLGRGTVTCYDNLVNAGIIPLVFADPSDYDAVGEGDDVSLPGIGECIASGTDPEMTVSGRKIRLKANLTSRQRKILKAGGLLRFTAEGRS